MTNPSDGPMLRLLERTGAGDANEDRVAALLRGSLVPRDPTPPELMRIGQALASPSRRGLRGPLIWRLALVLILLAAGAATAKAYELVRRAGWLGGSKPPAPTLREATQARRQKGPALRQVPPIAGGESVVPETLSAPSTAERAVQAMLPPPSRTGGPTTGSTANDARENGKPSLARSLLSHPATERRPEQALAHATPAASNDRRQSRAAVMEPISSAPASPPSIAQPPSVPAAPPAAALPPVSDEVRELDRAMALLRREHDAESALKALGRHLDRYPHGSLNQEARLARIDSLLMLGRNEQALRELEVASLGRGLRSTELLVVRAELRAAHDCRKAEEDFGLALGRGPDAGLLERILYGRGVCRVRMQDAAGAEQDVRTYLERFPKGRHAEWAHRWLLGGRGSAESPR